MGKGSEFLFQDGDRVCFVGDSITHGNFYMAYVFELYCLKYPNRKISLFNCGTGGDTAYNVLRRLEYDVLVHKPNKAVIMLGMNDVGGDEVYGEITLSDDVAEKRSALKSTYKKNMETIILELLKRNIQVTLVSPTPYDETVRLATQNHIGRNVSLAGYGLILKELASSYDCNFIDFHTPMTRVNLEMQKQDPTFTIIGPDRVHPLNDGCLLMSYLFLKQQGAAADPTIIEIGYMEKALLHYRKCKVHHLEFSTDKIMFMYEPRFLPIYLEDSYYRVDQLVPLTKDNNSEILQINGLPQGKYRLIIDHITIGVFSSEKFQKGINLNLEIENPIHEVTKKLREHNRKRFEVEQKIRSLRYIEKRPREEGVDMNNFNEVTSFINKELESYKGCSWYDYHHEQVERYFGFLKTEEKQLESDLYALTEGMYEQVKPVSYTFEIVNDDM